jgi:glycosyltransferase involved in cell wall biosynthesis
VRVRVGYDAQIFDIQQRGGISRYFGEIVAEFGRHDFGVDAHIVRPYSRIRRYTGAGASVARTIRLELNLRAVLREDVDVWHSTYYRARYLPRLSRRPHVITIHDMLPERFPECFPHANPHSAKADYARGASAVVVPSAYTASELRHFYPWLEAPVHIIPEAASTQFFRRQAERFPSALGQPYFLYVGARDGYKDFPVLLAALSEMEDSAEPHMVAVGGGIWSRSERAEIRRLGLTNRVSHVTPDDAVFRAWKRRPACGAFARDNNGRRRPARIGRRG